MFCSAFVYCIFVKVVYPTLLNTSGCVTIMIISFFLIMIIGSVNHPDMNWDKDEYAMCKKTTRIIALIEIGGIVAFYFMGVSASYILFMSSIFSSTQTTQERGQIEQIKGTISN